MTPAWWKNSMPDKVRPQPWIGAEAKRYFGELLKPDMSVLEYGAGGSTLWMQDKVKEVISVENDLKWADEIKMRCTPNVTLYYWDEPEPPEFDHLFHLVFIDGEPIERRANWIKALPRLIRANGIVVLDNANRPEFAKERVWLRNNAQNLFNSKGKGGTFTWTEFYQWLG
jgi:hypothetical protein